MKIDRNKLEINVNLHSLQPGFSNSELYYIIASNENNFRFVQWDELPEKDEEKFYCFLVEKELFIPAGNILLNKSYRLEETAPYPKIQNEDDFINVLETLENTGATKCIKNFRNEDLDIIKNSLEKKYGKIEMHVVRSDEAQHMLLVLNHAEISISSAMVYFRVKAPFAESHYEAAKEM